MTLLFRQSMSLLFYGFCDDINDILCLEYVYLDVYLNITCFDFFF